MTHKQFHTAIGAKLKFHRTQKDLTQQQVADKIKVNVRTIRTIEAGTNNTTAQILLDYSETVSIKFSKLLIDIGC